MLTKGKMLRAMVTESETVESAAAAIELAAEWLEGGALVRCREANDDPEDYTWIVESFELYN